MATTSQSAVSQPAVCTEDDGDRHSGLNKEEEPWSDVLSNKESWEYRRHQISITRGDKKQRKRNRHSETSTRDNTLVNNSRSEQAGGVMEAASTSRCSNLLYNSHSTFPMLSFPQYSQDVISAMQDSVRQYDLLKQKNVSEEGETESLNTQHPSEEDSITIKKEPQDDVGCLQSSASSGEDGWSSNMEYQCWDGSKQHCDKWFSKKCSLQNHTPIRSGIKNLTCELCQTKFKTLGEVKRHMAVHSADKTYNCKSCDKQFDRVGDLKKHQLIHKGEKRHECTECFRKFSQSGDLKRHYYTHSGERRYACDLCERRFTRHSDLKHHKLVHTGEKDCMCDLCGKYFKSQREMKRHRLVHDEVKKFACNLCDKRFSQLPGLQQHKVVHSGERKHECDVCFKKFTQSGTLKRHKLIHEKYEKLKRNILLENGTEVHVEFDNVGDGDEVRVKMEENSDDDYNDMMCDEGEGGGTARDT